MTGNQESVTLSVGGRQVAEYVFAPKLEPTLVPRPYLHPVRTLAGTVVTDLLPADHAWHLGVSLAMPDVAGANLWGGRSYVHERGYVWLDDHGEIEHVRWLQSASGELQEELRWRGPDGAALLTEQRTVRVEDCGDGRGWVLTFSFELTNAGAEAVELRSPAVNGRGEGAGYGGFFWRLPAISEGRVVAGALRDEDAINGSAEPSVTMSGLVDGAPVSLTFGGLAESDRWFVRLAEYPGIGAALAFERPLTIAPGASVRRRYQVLVSDGAQA